MNEAQAFFAVAEQGRLPAAVQGKMVQLPISTEQGTFLAMSENSHARAIAAIMACQDAKRAAKLTS
jgi:hypothetical protein